MALKKQMMALLEERGAAVPAEHNYGRLYQVPPEMEAHFKELDPCNVFNPGSARPHRTRTGPEAHSAHRSHSWHLVRPSPQTAKTPRCAGVFSR